MARTKNNAATVLVTSAIILILAIAFLTSIVEQTEVVTDKTKVSKEAVALVGMDVDSIDPTQTYELTYAPTGWKQDDCPITNYAVYNQSGTALTEDTDYYMNATYGTFALANTTDTQLLVGVFNNSYVSYDYCEDDYLNSSWGRSILQTNIGLYAIAILLVVVLLVYLLIGKEEN